MIVAAMVILTGCWNNQPDIDLDMARSDILLAEKEFAKMAADSGITPAFLYFAADDAVIMRNDEIVAGIENIRKYLSDRPSEGITLDWTPDFVDVSASGDLGYTYGKYKYTRTDSTGQEISAEGIFHTVWKKQADGKWKYVWD